MALPHYEQGITAGGVAGGITGGYSGVKFGTYVGSKAPWAKNVLAEPAYVSPVKPDVPKGGVLNGKPIWTPGKREDPVKNAFLHWKDHGREFAGLQNSKQYVEQAHSLFRDPSALRRVRSSDGACLRYDLRTNTFGSFNPQGVPKTMYKPIPGEMPAKYSTPLEYFYGQ